MECSQIKTVVKILVIGLLIRFTKGVTTSTEEVTGAEGSKVTLNCDRDGVVGGTLFWTFDKPASAPIVQVNSNGVIDIPTTVWSGDVHVSGTSLVITNLKLDRDDGTFYCSLQTDSATIAVSVLVPVKSVTISRTDNTPLSTVSLSRAKFTCSASSKPEASVAWHLVTSDGSITALNPEAPTSSSEGKLTQVVSALFYSPKREHDGGQITCQAHNAVTSGTVTSNTGLTIHYVPILEPPHTELQSVSVVEKSSLILKCTSWSNPKSDFTWKHGNEIITEGLENTDKGNRRWESTLTVSDTRMANAGIYTCSASNGLGTVEQPGFNVTVQMYVASENTGEDTGGNTAAIAAGVAVPVVLIICAIVAFVIIRARRKKHDKITKAPEAVVYGNDYSSDPNASYEAVVIGDVSSVATQQQQDNIRDGSPGSKHKLSAPGIQNGEFKNGADNHRPPYAVEYETTGNVRQSLIAQNKVPVNTPGLVYADLSHGVDLTKFPPPKPARMGEQKGTEYASIDINRTNSNTTT